MANNIRSIQEGYKVNTDSWTFIQNTSNTLYAWPVLPSSAIGKNIVYGFFTSQVYSNSYIIVHCFDGQWYINQGKYFSNLTLNSSTGVLSEGGSLRWAYGNCKCIRSFLIYT